MVSEQVWMLCVKIFFGPFFVQSSHGVYSLHVVV